MLRHKDLPLASVTNYSRIVDLYDHWELMGEKIPMGFSECENDSWSDIYYWQREKHELGAHELALMWAHGILA